MGVVRGAGKGRMGNVSIHFFELLFDIKCNYIRTYIHNYINICTLCVYVYIIHAYTFAHDMTRAIISMRWRRCAKQRGSCNSAARKGVTSSC